MAADDRYDFAVNARESNATNRPSRRIRCVALEATWAGRRPTIAPSESHLGWRIRAGKTGLTSVAVDVPEREAQRHQN